MSRLLAVVPAALCARALGRGWPEDLDGRVRCIDEGARALGLDRCCGPWSPEVEDAALRSELDGAASAEPYGNPEEAFARLDAVTAALARTPAAPPVMGLVSGPAAWRARGGDFTEDALDAASDLAAARVGALAGCGVERLIVAEIGVSGADLDRMTEAHRLIVRTAAHLRLEALLVMTGAGDAARLGYQGWASPGGCADDLGFLPKAAFDSAAGLRRGLDQCRRTVSGDAAEVVTAPLGPHTSPEILREASIQAAALSSGRGRAFEAHGRGGR